MVEIANIDFLYPRWLTLRLNAMRERWENFKNFQVMRRVRQAREFVRQAREVSLNHPVVTMFLAVAAVLSFLPIIIFLSIVFGSFAVIFVTAFTVFQSVVVVSLVPFLAVLVPILMIGGMAVVFAYLAYCIVVKILRIIERTIRQFIEIVKSTLPSRIFGRQVGFGGYKVRLHAIPQQFRQRYAAFPPTDQEPSSDC